jgi:hypothetical protein
LCDNIDVALRELLFHGEEIYYEWSQRIIDSFRKFYPHLKVKDMYMQYDTRLAKTLHMDTSLLDHVFDDKYVFSFIDGNYEGTMGTNLPLKINMIENKEENDFKIEPQMNMGDGPSITSLTEGADSSAQITHFDNSAVVKTNDIFNIEELKSMYYDTSNGLEESSVKSFLEKPVVITSGNLSVSDTISVFPRISLPVSIVQARNTLMLDKLSGYLGFRADIRIRWVINGERFQQGRYMLVFVMQGGGESLASTSWQRWHDYHVSTLAARTQLRRIEMDISCDSEGEILLPYASYRHYWPLSSVGTTSNPLYSAQIFYYNDAMVSPTGSTTAGYSIYANFENITLFGPAAPQMAINPSRKEQEKEGAGVISGPLLRVKKAANILSEIPLLAAVSGPVAWVSDILARSAAVFGWSKPANLVPVTRVIRDKTPYMWNYDMPDQALVLAASAGNSVQVLPGVAGTNTDEMDFSYLKSIFSFYASGTYSTSYVPGSNIMTIAVTPATSTIRIVASTGVVDHTPISFLSSRFRYWRGDLKYRFKFVKTEFHSGRIAIAFYPGSATPIYNNLNYVAKEIVDLRHQNEITITVPYVNITPWCLTAQDGDRNYTGYIGVYVIDPLVAPSSVSSTVPIYVEVAGGENLEFAVPLGDSVFQPIYGIAPQMNMSDEDACKFKEVTIGGMKSSPYNVSNSALCIGESVTSCRQLLKLASNYSWASAPSSTLRFLNLIPFANSVASTDGTTVTRPTYSTDWYGLLQNMYCFSRGGVRFKVYSGTLSGTAVTRITMSKYTPAGVYSPMTIATTDVAGSTDVSTSGYRPFATNFFNHQPVHDILVPQYFISHARPNRAYACLTGTIALESTDNWGVSITNSGNNSLSDNLMVFRSGADDSNFTGFVSIGPLISASTSTWMTT